MRHANPGLRILIVEDDPGFQLLLRDHLLIPLLQAAPGSVLTAVGSFEAMEDALRDIHRPDITILDLTLPPHDMRDTLARLDRIEDVTPVVILTGSCEERVRAIIGGRFTPVVEKTRLLPGFLERAIIFAIEKWHNHRWARIQECVTEIRRLALQAVEGIASEPESAAAERGPLPAPPATATANPAPPDAPGGS